MTAPRPTDDKATDYETSRREAMAAARHAIIALRDAAGVPEAALAHGYKVTAGCVTDDLGRVSAAISNYFLDAEPALRDRLAAVERERDEARRIGRLDWQEANNLQVWAEGAEERVNAAVARAVAAEARLAAVIKAAEDIARRIPSPFADNAVSAVKRAALAAPSPQAEPATCDHGKTEAHTYYDFNYDGPSQLRRCPGPQSTEETQP